MENFIFCAVYVKKSNLVEIVNMHNHSAFNSDIDRVPFIIKVIRDNPQEAYKISSYLKLFSTI